MSFLVAALTPFAVLAAPLGARLERSLRDSMVGMVVLRLIFVPFRGDIVQIRWLCVRVEFKVTHGGPSSTAGAVSLVLLAVVLGWYSYFRDELLLHFYAREEI